MITKQETFTDVVRGGAKSQEFTIDTDSSVIFEILRDKMYKDKIGAIAREVASNSRDANREAGSTNPVEIRIISPNKLLGIGHESISFKDSGAGIPPNKMADIYLKYGASDKRTTNKLTGGFGLGAKTPFAYNDTFTVLTVADFEGERREYKYTAMLDTSGKGKMVLFSDTLSDKETGTEIIVPIKNFSDRNEFEKKVLKYTKTWGEEVAYFNFNNYQEDLDTVFEEENFDLYFSKDYLYGDRLEMVIDGIPYPIDNGILNLSDTVGRIDDHFLTVLKFQTGELSISANRESVQYDEETIALIKERHTEFKEFLNKKLNVLVEAEETYLEACIMTYYINRASSKKVNPPTMTRALLAHAKGSGVKLSKPTWRGIPTMAKADFLHHNVYFVTLENGKNKYSLQSSIEIFNDFSDSPVVYADTRKSASRNATIWDEGKRAFYLITPIDKDRKEGIEEFMNFIFKLDLDFRIYSEVEPMKAEAGAKGVYVKKSYVTLNIRVQPHYSLYKETFQLERKTFKSANGEDLSKYVYAKVDRLAYANVSSGKFKFLKERGYTPIVVRSQDYDNWFSKTPMKHYEGVYDMEYAKWEADLIAKKQEIAKKQMIVEIVEDFLNETTLPLLESVLPKSAQGVRLERSEYISSEEIAIVKPTLKFDFDGLRTKIRTIFTERYPLIKVIQRSYNFSREDSKKHTELYIKQVNNYYGN